MFSDCIFRRDEKGGKLRAVSTERDFVFVAGGKKFAQDFFKARDAGLFFGRNLAVISVSGRRFAKAYVKRTKSVYVKDSSGKKVFIEISVLVQKNFGKLFAHTVFNVLDVFNGGNLIDSVDDKEDVFHLPFGEVFGNKFFVELIHRCQSRN